MESIADRTLAGAGLDDPPAQSDSPLFGRPNVVFAPHHGNRAIEGVNPIFRAAIDNAATALRGERPGMLVNPKVYDRNPWTAVRSPSS